ncbi:MAG: alcohol dehydrogenase catalytic domain-containing protein [Thermodesulfobacteriota bacterium]|jgi:alcohol dehydrogenase
MKGVVLMGGDVLELKEVPEPRLEKVTDAILKVTTASICGSDIHIKHGMMHWITPGTILGHEFVGVIEEVGREVSTFKKGDRVVASGSFQCGKCFFCKNGDIGLCEIGGAFGGGGKKSGIVSGGQAEYVRIPFADNSLEEIPDGLEDEDVIFVGDILSTGFHGAIMSGIKPGDSVVVFGCGPVGLCAQVCAKIMGGVAIGVDIVDFRLKTAEAFGSIPINAEKENVIEKIRNLTQGRGADVVIEAVGSESTFSGSIKAVRRGGTVSILGIFPQALALPIQKLCFYTLKISIGLANISHMAELIKLIQAGRINLRPLITHTFPLSRALQGYEIFENRKDTCIKVLLKP